VTMWTSSGIGGEVGGRNRAERKSRGDIRRGGPSSASEQHCVG
jgi:hypothetical protein